MSGPMLIALPQAALVFVAAAESGGSTVVAAVISGVFLVVNTALTLYLSGRRKRGDD